MKRTFGRRCVLPAGMLALLLFPVSVWAFPTWMGVYGAFERHAGGNPGTYTILMNQDYFGLHAEVGYQVNGGAWQTAAMTYSGNVDGNSKWMFTPAVAYPAGATVNFYFHGWDDWGGHIYDSANAQNYSFTTPGGGGGGLNWGAPKSLPAPASATDADVAAHNGMLYAVWGPDSVGFSRMAPGATWEAAVPIPAISNGMAYPRIAASASGVHVIYSEGAEARYVRSLDGGLTWSAPISFSAVNHQPTRYAELRADSNYVYAIYNDYAPPENSRLLFRRMHKNASVWESPVLIFSNVAYKTTVYVSDVEVRAPTVALSSYAASWYGGYSKWFFHESTNDGASWTAYSNSGNSASMDLDASGKIHLASYDNTAQGGGIYYSSKNPGGPFGARTLVWPGDGPIDGLRQLDAGLVAVAQRSNLRYARVSADGGATWANPELVDSTGSFALKDLRDGARMHLLLKYVGSSPIYVTISSGASTSPPLQWVGNTYHWPVNAELDAADDLWINVESYPKDAGASAAVVYQVNGGAWTSAPLVKAGVQGANDWWHKNLGKFPAQATIKYAVVVYDGTGAPAWDNNGGADFEAKVGGASTVQVPMFWALDPYRGDRELVRLNGNSANPSTKFFAEYQAGQALTVVARPVENGNGNLVQQYQVETTSTLTFTTTPGNWSNAQTVTGVFHAAWLSNKPNFDHFSYNLGYFPAGTTVYFWLGAWNSAGAGYAQSAGQDYWFTVVGGSADSDLDGMPDAWEVSYFTNLSATADGNPDGDGPITRPLANLIEYAVGLNPWVPNDPMGVKLLWSPAHPAQGGQVTLSYFYVNQANPLFGKPVYAHIGKNGWQDVYDSPQLQLNGQISRFETTLTVPADATELNVVFTDKAGRWDNNGGADWKIPVRTASPAPPAAAPLPSSVPARAAAPASGETSGPEVSIIVSGDSATGELYVLSTTDGWSTVSSSSMKRLRNGRWFTTLRLPSGSQVVNFVLSDGRRLDLNGGQGWTCRLAGNGNHKVLVQKKKTVRR